MITSETALAIAYAYREIETAEKLLAEIAEAMKHREAPDIRDVFGRSQPGLQLGVPHGRGGHQLFNVPWNLSKIVIEAHIQQQRTELAALNEVARMEAEK